MGVSDLFLHDGDRPFRVLTFLRSVLSAALDHFSDRLLAGARTDLLELAKIPFIKSRTACVYQTVSRRNSQANTLFPQPRLLGIWVPQCWCYCQRRSERACASTHAGE